MGVTTSKNAKGAKGANVPNVPKVPTVSKPPVTINPNEVKDDPVPNRDASTNRVLWVPPQAPIRQSSKQSEYIRTQADQTNCCNDVCQQSTHKNQLPSKFTDPVDNYTNIMVNTYANTKHRTLLKNIPM